MTPLEIEIVLHYYSSAGDFRDGDFSAPAVREAITWMQNEDILQADAPGTRAYELAPRGRAFVDALMALPLPTQMWVMPTDTRRHRRART